MTSQDAQVQLGPAVLTDADRVIASDTLLDNAHGLAAHRALGFEEVERSIHFRKPL